MNRPYYYIVLLLLLFALPLLAEQPASAFEHGRHSIRIGWGDAWLSNVKEHLGGIDCVPLENTNYLQHIQGMPASQAHEYLTDYRMALDDSHKISSTGHFFVGYRYQLTSLIGVGMEADLLTATDCFHMVDGYRTTIDKQARNQLFCLTLMPTVRFTYYCQRIIELYSALGVGYNCIAYTSNVSNVVPTSVLFECPFYNSPVHGMSLNATLFGVNVGNEHWYAEAELGGMCSWLFLWPQSTWGPLYGSRLFSLAVGYRF